MPPPAAVPAGVDSGRGAATSTASTLRQPLPTTIPAILALFQQERISLSRASRIAGIEIMDFQKLLAERGICVHYDVEDFEQDVQHLRERGWL